MTTIYKDILKCTNEGRKMLAVLIDPDKITINKVANFVSKINSSVATHIFVGGSTVADNVAEILVKELKKHTELPIVLFPGDVSQISNEADALLFLSLISGNNPDYLINKHVKAVEKLRNSQLEVIPTGYLLIENGKKTSVEKVTQTLPLSRSNIKLVSNTAKAGEYLGMKLIYLEAGSGAEHPVPASMISEVRNEISIPLIVGGGIRTKEQLTAAFRAGADLIVIGTALENDETFFNELTLQL